MSFRYLLESKPRSRGTTLWERTSGSALEESRDPSDVDSTSSIQVSLTHEFECMQVHHQPVVYGGFQRQLQEASSLWDAILQCGPTHK